MDNDGKVLGEIYGNANDAKNNNAKTLLIKNIILLKKDKFFNGLNFCLLIFPGFKQKIFFLFC